MRFPRRGGLASQKKMSQQTSTAPKKLTGALSGVTGRFYAGIAAGIGLAIAGQQLVESFLTGVTPKDPVTIFGVAGVLLVVATIAAHGPARRAARIDPAQSLR